MFLFNIKNLILTESCLDSTVRAFFWIYFKKQSHPLKRMASHWPIQNIEKLTFLYIRLVKKQIVTFW